MKSLSQSLRLAEVPVLTNLGFWKRAFDIESLSWLKRDYCLVPWWIIASMDIEITDDSFHVSFGIIRQLWKVYHSLKVLVLINLFLWQRAFDIESFSWLKWDYWLVPWWIIASTWILRSLMTHSMNLLASLGSYEKTFKVSQVSRTTCTHQYSPIQTSDRG